MCIKAWEVLTVSTTLPSFKTSHFVEYRLYEPRHGKTNKMSVRPAKPQISLDIRPVWSQSLLAAWRKLGSLAIHWAHSEDSDQTGRMPRLIWVFAGRTLILLVLLCRDSKAVGQVETPNTFQIHKES